VASVFLASAILVLGTAVIAGWLLQGTPKVRNK